jgi:hypothetical protein
LRNSGYRNHVAAVEVDNNALAAVTTRNEGMVMRPKSSRGSSWRRDDLTNTTPPMTATTNTATIRMSNHPHARPWTITKVAPPTANVPVTVPSRSSGGGRSVTLSSAMNFEASTMPAKAMGTTIAKTTRQLETSRSPAATVGAAAAPSTPIDDHSETTAPCRCFG